MTPPPSRSRASAGGGRRWASRSTRTRRGSWSPPTGAAATAPGCASQKLELQRLADETGLEIAVCHFPPGTSKWNKVEHRLFSAITQNWRGKPLVSHETVVNLIAATTTRTGLKVRSELDTNAYPKGVKVGDAEMKSLYHQRDTFHGEWNYSLMPRLMLPQE